MCFMVIDVEDTCEKIINDSVQISFIKKNSLWQNTKYSLKCLYVLLTEKIFPINNVQNYISLYFHVVWCYVTSNAFPFIWWFETWSLRHTQQSVP